MSITHEHARKLIQWNMDQKLNAHEASLLSTHLHDCSECTAYASEIKEATSILIPLMKRQWNAQPAPLSIPALTGRNEKIKANALLTMRTALMSFAVMALFFSVWQFVSSSPNESQIPLPVSPVPTPSVLTAASASTQVTLESCAMTLYTVQAQDTLASIAGQFSISEDTIIELNRLETNALRPAMELTIPICKFTPTGTTHPATFTTTFTPVLNDTPSTPNG